MRAAASSRPSQSGQALESLCAIYWPPLYAYIRHRGNSAEDAKDLTQEFFARFLEKDYLKDVDPAKGKFRSFLLASVNHFLSNERDRARTLKRGGGVSFLPLDFTEIELRYRCGALHTLSPEKMFERAWALALLDSALSRLRLEYELSGKTGVFESLKSTLTAQEPHVPYRDLAAELAMSEEAVKTAAHRLRRRYRDVLLDEIAQTLPEGENVEEELRGLFAALGA
ncbi:MAG: sigma-70 family RNA polymerase sigma factor [Candidatus Hydrogenedentes bacterium]|nr:sigma-70 family RNA polymerase sigma factor [Candidatus Hydrogenedentota bacterium]